VGEPTVSLSRLLQGDSAAVTGQTEVGLSQYVEEILASGFPGIRDLPQRARDVQINSYLRRVVERDLQESGVAVRRPTVLLSWLAAYAAATSTDAAYSTILDAATAGEPDRPARQTVDGYRDHLTRIFLLDPLPAWLPTFAPLKRLTRTPKHHLVDPALSARLVGVGREGLLGGGPAEADRGSCHDDGDLARRTLRVAGHTERPRVRPSSRRDDRHLRTKNTDREVNLIVEGPDRRVVAIEVKLAATVSDADVRHLHWLHDQLGERLADRVVITTGSDAYRRRDGVAVVPLALLGP